MHPCSRSIRLYYRSARYWRAEARSLRTHAEYLPGTQDQRTALLTQAGVLDQLANTWIKEAQAAFLTPA